MSGRVTEMKPRIHYTSVIFELSTCDYLCYNLFPFLNSHLQSDVFSMTEHLPRMFLVVVRVWNVCLFGIWAILSQNGAGCCFFFFLLLRVVLFLSVLESVRVRTCLTNLCTNRWLWGTAFSVFVFVCFKPSGKQWQLFYHLGLCAQCCQYHSRCIIACNFWFHDIFIVGSSRTCQDSSTSAMTFCVRHLHVFRLENTPNYNCQCATEFEIDLVFFTRHIVRVTPLPMHRSRYDLFFSCATGNCTVLLMSSRPDLWILTTHTERAEGKKGRNSSVCGSFSFKTRSL